MSDTDLGMVTSLSPASVLASCTRTMDEDEQEKSSLDGSIDMNLVNGPNPWLPAYGFQLQHHSRFQSTHEDLRVKDAVPVQQVEFLETIFEETSDDLQSDSDHSGTTYWLGSDSETESVIHIERKENVTGERINDNDTECNSIIPKKKCRRNNNTDERDPYATFDDFPRSPRSSRSSGSSRSSSLLQFESLERTCATLSPSSYSFDSLEYSNHSNVSHLGNTSPDSLEQDNDAIVQNGYSNSVDHFPRIRPYRSFESLDICQKAKDYEDVTTFNERVPSYSKRKLHFPRSDRNELRSSRNFWYGEEEEEEEEEEYENDGDDEEFEEEDERLLNSSRRGYFEDRLHIFGDSSCNYATSLDYKNTIDLREIGIESKRDAFLDLKSSQKSTSSSTRLLQTSLNITGSTAHGHSKMNTEHDSRHSRHHHLRQQQQRFGHENLHEQRQHQQYQRQRWTEEECFNFRFTDKSQSAPSLASIVDEYAHDPELVSSRSKSFVSTSNLFENYTKVNSVPIDLDLCGVSTTSTGEEDERSCNDMSMRDHKMAEVKSLRGLEDMLNHEDGELIGSNEKKENNIETTKRRSTCSVRTQPAQNARIDVGSMNNDLSAMNILLNGEEDNVDADSDEYEGQQQQQKQKQQIASTVKTQDRSNVLDIAMAMENDIDAVVDEAMKRLKQEGGSGSNDIVDAIRQQFTSKQISQKVKKNASYELAQQFEVDERSFRKRAMLPSVVSSSDENTRSPRNTTGRKKRVINNASYELAQQYDYIKSLQASRGAFQRMDACDELEESRPGRSSRLKIPADSISTRTGSSSALHLSGDSRANDFAPSLGSYSKSTENVSKHIDESFFGQIKKNSAFFSAHGENVNNRIYVDDEVDYPCLESKPIGKLNLMDTMLEEDGGDFNNEQINNDITFRDLLEEKMLLENIASLCDDEKRVRNTDDVKLQKKRSFIGEFYPEKNNLSILTRDNEENSPSEKREKREEKLTDGGGDVGVDEEEEEKDELEVEEEEEDKKQKKKKKNNKNKERQVKSEISGMSITKKTVDEVGENVEATMIEGRNKKNEAEVVVEQQAWGQTVHGDRSSPPTSNKLYSLQKVSQGSGSQSATATVALPVDTNHRSDRDVKQEEKEEEEKDKDKDNTMKSAMTTATITTKKTTESITSPAKIDDISSTSKTMDSYKKNDSKSRINVTVERSASLNSKQQPTTTITTIVKNEERKKGGIGCFLQRFSKLRFSGRSKVPRSEIQTKGDSSRIGQQHSNRNEFYHDRTKKEPDYIIIPLHPPDEDRSKNDEIVAFENRSDDIRRINNVDLQRSASSVSSVRRAPVCSSKPPLPPQPPRLVSSGCRISGAVGSSSSSSSLLSTASAPSSSLSPAPAAPPSAPAPAAIAVVASVSRRRATTDLGNPAAIEMAKARAMQAAQQEQRPLGLLETDLDDEVVLTTNVNIVDSSSGSCNNSNNNNNVNNSNKKTRSLLDLNHTSSVVVPQGTTTLENALRVPQLPVSSCHRNQRNDGTPSGIDQRPHKSMEFLLDKENLHFVKPPENELQKVGERVPSEHELRVQRSLQRLNVPDWYKNSPTARDGFRLKRHSDASQHGGWRALGSKTTSLSSLSSSSNRQPTTGALLSPSPTPPVFSRWSTSLLNSAGSSPASSAKLSFYHRQPYLGWRSQERLSNPRTPAERLAQGILSQLQSPNKQQQQQQQQQHHQHQHQQQHQHHHQQQQHHHHHQQQQQQQSQQPQHHHQQTTNQQLAVRNSIKEVTSAIVHYVQSGQEVDGSERLSPLPRPEDWEDRGEVRSTSPRGSARLCWMESSFVGTRPVDSPETPMSLATDTECCVGCNATCTESCSCMDSVTSGLYLDVTPPLDDAQQQQPLIHGSIRAGGSLCPSSPSSSSANYNHPQIYQQRQHQQQHQQQQQRHHRDSGHGDMVEMTMTSAVPRNKPSPGSTTLEDVLDSLLGLPPASRTPSPGPGPVVSSTTSTSMRHHRSNIGQTNAKAGKSCSDLRQDLQESVRSTIELQESYEDQRGSCDAVKLTRRKSDGSDLISSKTASASLQSKSAGQQRRRRVSFDNAQQERNGLTTNAIDKIVHCRNNKCTNSATLLEARKSYKSCHNCTCLYCSRECRRAHWQRHRRICLHSRAGSLCKEVLSSAKEDPRTLRQISALAKRGYSSHGRGAVKCFFSSPEAAERFVENGFPELGEPTYIRWSDLLPGEMGAELYAEVMRLCKSYNPDTRLVLYVAICVVSEVPTSGAVKWERQLVSRCAKLRLDSTFRQPNFSTSPQGKQQTTSPCNITREMDSPETLVLTSLPTSTNVGQNASRRAREIGFTNIQRQLKLRGVSLKRHFPQVYRKLCSYVDGSVDKFAPVTIYPRDQTSGKSFMCIIMLDAEPERLRLLPTDSSRVKTVDISVEQE